MSRYAALNVAITAAVVPLVVAVEQPLGILVNSSLNSKLKIWPPDVLRVTRSHEKDPAAVHCLIVITIHLGC